jgi:hypothetical protein
LNVGMISPAKTSQKMYQLKVSLSGSQPEIWRRLTVAGDIQLSELHEILQAVMPWSNCHLHRFQVGETGYGPVMEEMGDEMDTEDENEFRLDEVAPSVKDRIIYEYDFGDGWEHVLTVEAIGALPEDYAGPRCTAGKNACPPDDCGGIGGYYESLKVLQDPKHSDHDHLLEWFGGEFDPHYFELDETNQRLGAK